MKKIFRFLKLQKYKIFRIKDFPESVAIGMAWGTSVSVTPALGLHLITCYLGTWIMRGNFVAATVGTIFTNIFWKYTCCNRNLVNHLLYNKNFIREAFRWKKKLN